MNVCHIQIQSFFLYHHLEMIKKNSNKELVFHPEYDSIKYIHHIKKMKSKYDNIVKNKTVFEIRKTHTPDVYELWYLKNNKKVKNSIACISTMKTSKFVRKIFEDNKYLELLKQNVDRKSLVVIATKLKIAGHTNHYNRPYIKKNDLFFNVGK